MNYLARLKVFGSAVAALVVLATATQAGPCIIPAPGDFPPECDEGYTSPDDVHRIIDGLPPGTTIELDAAYKQFHDIVRTPGGSLGGEQETFLGNIDISMSGTGDLDGYVRSLSMSDVQFETHIGPRNPTDPVQDFDTEMVALQGQIIGDPDFDLLRITAGSNFGLPSPGHTTLTRLPSGNFNVDSFFDVTYRIDFTGAPGGPLADLSGSTTGTIRMQAGEPVPEPSSVILLVLGVFGVAGWMRRAGG